MSISSDPARGKDAASGVGSALRAADKWLQHVERAGMLLAACATAAIMFVTVVDVIFRYFFNSPLIWSYELITNYFMPCGMFLALATTLQKGEHVNVDMVIRTLPERARNLVLLLTYVLVGGFFALMFREGAYRTAEAWSAGEAMVGLIAWPIWASQIFVPLGSALILARVIWLVLASAARVLWPGAVNHLPEVMDKGPEGDILE